MKQSPKPRSFPILDLSAYSTDGELPEPTVNQQVIKKTKCNNYTSGDISAGQSGRDLFDFKYINRLPIVEVARKVGFDFRGGKIVCPRSYEHTDRKKPFLTVLGSNKVICADCDTYPMTVLDMVQDFCGITDDLRDAAEYICNFFSVSPIPRGAHLHNPAWDRVPPGCRNPISLLVRSGVWTGLSVPTQRLIPLLLDFANWEEGMEECELILSGRAMMRYSGIGSPNSISEAITELEAIGWLVRLGSIRRTNSVTRETRKYRLTPLSECVRHFADTTAPGFGDAIRMEKADSKRKRDERDRWFQSK